MPTSNATADANQIERLLREVRVQEFYLYYDTVVIGQGAREIDNGWFDSFADLANADTIQWLKGRSGNVGRSYSNTGYDRRDLAIAIDHIALEFILPTTAAAYAEQGEEAHAIPSIFAKELPDSLAIEAKIQGLDQILEVPARRIPAGAANAAELADQLGIGAYYPGTNGQAVVSNMLHLPEPWVVPSANTLLFSGRIDAPLRPFLAQYGSTPGYDNFPNQPPGTFTRKPRWYKMRLVLFARRRAQFRGARTAP